MTAGKCFNTRLVKIAGLGDGQGEALVSFPDLPFAIPRGKYNMDMFEEYAKLHGKTNDYKVMYKDIKKVFQLSRTDLQQIALVI